jgi:hypothetical protein
MPWHKLYKNLKLIQVLWVLIALLVLVFVSMIGNKARAPEPPEEKSRISKPAPTKTPPPPPTVSEIVPGAGTKLMPSYRLVALYGSPGSPVLGVMGERPMGETLDLAKSIAAQYQPFSTEKILPALEIITTIASAAPTENGDYSKELDVAAVTPWVEAARQAGVYVVLDLQPGRMDFLSQAKQYESLLKQPNVGLALDPEWRLKPDQVHLKQIGSVDVGEVNAVSAWLADLTAGAHLPQKLFLVHQFRLSMIANRTAMNTSRTELAYVIQMDGNGAQSTKHDTWINVIANPPTNVQFGWKNFYDEDHPVLSPEQTMQIQPQPWYISYQ